MRIETWKSNKGNREIHHFVDGTQTYLFGFNKQYLGKKMYGIVRLLIETELHMRDEKPNKRRSKRKA